MLCDKQVIDRLARNVSCPTSVPRQEVPRTGERDRRAVVIGVGVGRSVGAERSGRSRFPSPWLGNGPDGKRPVEGPEEVADNRGRHSAGGSAGPYRSLQATVAGDLRIVEIDGRMQLYALQVCVDHLDFDCPLDPPTAARSAHGDEVLPARDDHRSVRIDVKRTVAGLVLNRKDPVLETDHARPRCRSTVSRGLSAIVDVTSFFTR